MYDVTVDSDKFRLDLAKIRQDQLPFAFSLGINNTAKGARDIVRTQLDVDFTINSRRRPFFKGLIRFPRAHWATKRKLSATLGVHQTDEDVGVGSSKDRGFLLGRHEDGGERRRSDPARPFFVPTSALRSGQYDVPPRNMYPTALRLFESFGTVRTVKVTTGPAGDWGKRKTRRVAVKGVLAAQPKGKRGTFIVDARATKGGNAWGIFQRFGRGRRDVRMIWAFRSKLNLSPRLKFGTRVEKYVSDNIEREVSAAMDHAMRTAR